MTPTEFLQFHLQPSAEPALAEAELASLLELAKRQDANGLLPTDTGWTETYDLISAVVAGWELKAAKVAGNYLFQDDTLALHREQVHAQCLAMAEIWRRKSAGNVRVVSPHAHSPYEEENGAC